MAFGSTHTAQPPITPDHALRTKGPYLLVERPPYADQEALAATLRGEVERYRHEYRQYFERNRSRAGAGIAGRLAGAEFVTDPVFGIEVPAAVPGVPSEVLRPRETWADGEAYDQAAAKLAEMFIENFERFADRVPDEVKSAGPR